MKNPITPSPLPNQSDNLYRESADFHGRKVIMIFDEDDDSFLGWEDESGNPLEDEEELQALDEEMELTANDDFPFSLTDF